jgi:hypothetical protein
MTESSHNNDDVYINYVFYKSHLNDLTFVLIHIPIVHE